MGRFTSAIPALPPSNSHKSVPAEQLAMLLAHTEVGVIAATAFAVLISLGLYTGSIGHVPRDWVVGWAIVKVLVIVPRVIVARLSRDAAVLGSAPKALRMIVVLLGLDGCVWGVGGAYLMGGTTDTWSLIAAYLCCVAVVATFGLQVKFAAAAAYATPIIAPLVVALLARGGSAADTAALGLALLLGLLLLTSKRAEKNLAELIALRIHSDQASVDLEAALALARKHSEAKDRFLAVVSHELRTPLHGILGLNRLTRADLPKNASSSLTHYRLELMEDAGLHLQRMVNDLLDISFMESGKLQLVPLPFNLHQELDSITTTYHARAPEVGISFTAYIQPSLAGFIVGDKGRLAQVLHNLLGNAFKFTPLGGSVSLAVERFHGTDTIQFLVRDTGPGVAQSEQEAIFDPFTQGSFAGSRPEGVGLGLAISRQLARAMLGDVVCRSAVPSGSEFSFTAVLPVYAPALGDRPLPSEIAKPRSSIAGLTVYVADDDSLTALIHGSVVRSIGCELETFGDGQQLVTRVLNASESPAAIVLDWDMPVLDGRAATLAIRRHEQATGSRPVPIIGLSANSLASYRVAGIEAGMTLFLTKPCTLQALADALTSVLERAMPVHAPSTFDQRHSTVK